MDYMYMIAVGINPPSESDEVVDHITLCITDSESKAHDLLERISKGEVVEGIDKIEKGTIIYHQLQKIPYVKS